MHAISTWVIEERKQLQMSPILKPLVKAYWEWKSNGRLKILTDPVYPFYQNHKNRKNELRQAQKYLVAERKRREYHGGHKIWPTEAVQTHQKTERWKKAHLMWKASIHVRMLTQRYPINGNRTAGKAYENSCPLCGDIETMIHFLLQCLAMAKDQQPCMQKLANTCYQCMMRGTISEEDAVKLILDPTHFTTITGAVIWECHEICASNYIIYEVSWWEWGLAIGGVLNKTNERLTK